MAKKKRAQGSIRPYFRSLFQEHPEWLSAKTNSMVFDRYRADHGLDKDAPIDDRIKQNLANLKTEMRKAAGVGGFKDRPIERETPSGDLETLEEHIDECMSLARRIDAQGLDEVYRLLRRARAHVGLKLG